jgi:hypothetical protein
MDSAKWESPMVIYEAAGFRSLLLPLANEGMDNRWLNRKATLTTELGACIFSQLINNARILKDPKGMRIKVRFIRLVH